MFCRDIGREYLIRNGLLDKAAPPYLHLHVQKMSLLTDSLVLANLVKSGLPVSASQTGEHFGQRAPYGPDDVLKPLKLPDGNAHDPADLASPLILQRPDGRWAILFDAAQPAAMPPPAKKVKPEGTTFTVVGYRQTVEPGTASLTASGCYRHPVGPVADVSLP